MPVRAYVCVKFSRIGVSAYSSRRNVVIHDDINCPKFIPGKISHKINNVLP